MKYKDTKIIKIDDGNVECYKLNVPADILKSGGLVAFPTETVYGLGANALNEEYVSNIYKAKGRPSDNPLIVHIAEISQLDNLVSETPQNAKKLMDAFWPGPLTLIFNKSNNVPNNVTGGLNTVAVRMPRHKIALDLIKKANVPVAAPSANTSGKPSPTDANHVIEDLMGRVDVIIDGGQTGVGVESTVLDITCDPPTILRPGGVTKENLLEVLENVNFDPALKDAELAPKSPGMKYTHYSPKASVKIVCGDLKNIPNRIMKEYNKLTNENFNVGILCTEETKNYYEIDNNKKLVIGDRSKPETIASNLFKCLRKFDTIGVDIILTECIEEKGIGRAVMNRLIKAAGGNIIIV